MANKEVSKRFFRGALLVIALAATLAVPARVWGAGANATPIYGWLGEYYGSHVLAGSPALVRDDAAIDFDWGHGSPANGLPADRFSVRWTRSLHFAGGTYRFFALADDGVRVWLDGELIIDQWHISPGNTYTVERTLSTGTHLIRVEYYEEGGGARARFWWEALGTQHPAWRGEYYANSSLDGSTVLVRDDAEIDFDWGPGSPAAGLPADGFSARWTSRVHLPAATYRFHVIADGGVCLWVGGELIIDAWQDGENREFSADYTSVGGSYDLKVEYSERRGDARIVVWWEKSEPAFPDWKGEYWTNRYLSGDPILVQNEGRVDFDWGLGSAAAGLPVDNWSARWTRSAHFDARTYRFHLVVDDAARLWIDDRLIVDEWRDGGPREVIVDYAPGWGQHSLRLEFYERGGEAQMRLWWE